MPRSHLSHGHLNYSHLSHRHSRHRHPSPGRSQHAVPQPRTRKSRGKPPATGHRARAQPGWPEIARPSEAMGADPGTAGRPAIQADPAAVTGAQTAPPPTQAGPHSRPRLDMRRLPQRVRATRQPAKGPDTPQLAPAPATRRPPQERDHRVSRARASRQLPGERDPGVGPGDGDANPPRAASPAPASPSPRRRQPGPTAGRRHGRTRGGARNGGPARRFRERRATVLPAGDRSLVGHCGAPAPSGRRVLADAARCEGSRPRPEHPTRCTRRASSRRGTRPRSAR